MASPSYYPAAPARKRQDSRVIDIVSFVMLLFVVLGTFFPLETYLAAGGEGQEVALPLPVNSLALLATGLFLAFLLYYSVRRHIEITHVFLIYFYVAIAFLSAGWSYDAKLSILRALRLATTVGLAVAFASLYDVRKFVWLLLCALLTSAVLSIAVSVAVPSLGLSRLGGGYEGAWRGAQGHKNFAGLVYAFGALVAYLAYLFRAAPKWLIASTFLSCAVMVAMAQSASAAMALVQAIVIVTVMGWIRVLPRNVRYLAAFSLIFLVVAAALAIISNLEWIADLIGRDLTLTGRTFIWDAVWRRIAEHPWLGYGYGFWSSENPEVTRIRIDIGDMTAAHSHNTWLDIWLQLGLFALAAMIVVWVFGMAKGINQFLMRGIDEALIPLAFLLFFVVRSFTEINVTDPSIRGVFWIAWSVAFIARTNSKRRHSSISQPVMHRQTGYLAEFS